MATGIGDGVQAIDIGDIELQIIDPNLAAAAEEGQSCINSNTTKASSKESST